MWRAKVVIAPTTIISFDRLLLIQEGDFYWRAFLYFIDRCIEKLKGYNFFRFSLDVYDRYGAIIKTPLS